MSDESKRDGAPVPEHVLVNHEPGDPAIPNAPATSINTNVHASGVPEDQRAPADQISPAPGSDTSRMNAPQGGTGVPNTDAGKQFGEEPSPIPAQFGVRTANEDTGVRALPAQAVKTLQPTPEVVGTHQVVLDVATPDPGKAAITAPAPRVASLGPYGLTQLARQVYGDESRALDIFDANKDTMTSPDSWLIGQTVRLPD